MNIIETACKTALSTSKLPGLNYSLNPYRGCQHQCAYCYVPSVLRISRENWNNTLTIKRNIPSVLAKELSHKKPGTIGISTVTDPYQPIEKKCQLTRYCLDQLLKKDFPISIQTKSSLILRDKELITQFSQAEVLVSIATLNENYKKILEPHASSIEQRIQILKEFSKTPVKTSVFYGPIYPTTEQEVHQMMDIYTELNISRIFIDTFHMKPGIKNILINTTNSHPEFQKKLLDHLSQQEIAYDKVREIIRSRINDTQIQLVEAFK
jgi:DNA repair photolyase